jgi:hypothetical protein
MLYKMNVHFVSTLGKLIINTFCISDFFQNWSLLGPSKKKDKFGCLSQSDPVSPTNKIFCQNMNEILLKMSLNTINLRMKGIGLWCLTSLSTIFPLYHVVSFIGGGNQSPCRKPRPVASQCQTLSHNVISSIPHHERQIQTHNLIAQVVVNPTTMRSLPRWPPVEW